MFYFLYSLIIHYNSVKWAETNGTTYKLGAIVVVGSELMPSFAEIVDIVFLR